VTVSIVVEWETVLEGKHARGAACLASLRTQVASAETVICFDPVEASEESVRAAIGADWPGTLIVAPVPSSLDYYGKKNHGFTLTTGDIVVFLDSDLIPESDWLRNLIEPFTDFRKSLVVGRTHLETSAMYERAVALFWIFDARDESPLRPTARLVSNNVAFRRALFKHFPFPDRPTFRGQCSELASILESRGITMYEEPSARASHPAPDGVRRFLSRAFHAGRDHAFYDALAGNASIAQSLRNWRTDRRHVRERIALRAPLIRANRADRAAARMLGHIYYATKALGALTSATRARKEKRSDLSAAPFA
jgi:glycosyltransferase involved in cell wall biosynthesis